MTTEQPIVTYETTGQHIVTYEPYTADAVNTTVATTIFTTFNVTTAVPENNSNLGLIIGLSVGIPCSIAVIIAVIVTIICLRRRKSKENTSNKHKDFHSTDLNTTRTPYVTQDSRNQIYENFPIPRRDDAIYENSPESEDFYETRLPAS